MGVGQDHATPVRYLLLGCFTEGISGEHSAVAVHKHYWWLPMNLEIAVIQYAFYVSFGD